MTREPDSPSIDVWADAPLDANGIDEYGRDPFVRTVARQIDLAAATDPSTVFGLVGEWGSGKTSVIEQVRVQLDDTWHITEFTPWSAGDSSAMSVEFVTTLAAALGVTLDGETRAKFAKYAAFATPLLQAVPVFGAGLSPAADNVIAKLTERPPWHTQFDELSRLVSDVGLKILLVIDDVDRLGSDELMTLLKIVRLLGRFTGVHYLIAYDQHTVEDLLRSAGMAARSGSFMEKIVQYPFEVPPVSRAAAIRKTDEIVHDVIERAGVSLDDSGMQRRSDLVAILAPMMRTPRNLERFRSQSIAFADHVRTAELDPLDYLAVTWLRLRAHSLWEQLPLWQHELLNGVTASGSRTEKSVSAEDWIDRIVALDYSDPRGLLRLLGFLFEAVDTATPRSVYPRLRGVADRDYFSRYLLLDIPEDDVSDLLVGRAIECLIGKRPDSAIDELRSLIDPDSGLSTVVLQRAFSMRRTATTTSGDLVEFLLSCRRRQTESGESDELATANLSAWLTFEVGLALEHNVVPVEQLLDYYSLTSLSRLVMQSARHFSNPERPIAILQQLADHALKDFDDAYTAAQSHNGGVATLTKLIARAHGDDAAEQCFESRRASFEQYLSLAKEFAVFNTWSGTEQTYELVFDSGAFEIATSSHDRERYAQEAARGLGEGHVQTDDLAEPALSPEELETVVRRALVVYESPDETKLSDDVPHS